MGTLLAAIGRPALALCQGVGQSFWLLWDCGLWIASWVAWPLFWATGLSGRVRRRRGVRIHATAEQGYRVGPTSLPISCLVLFFLGMILALQTAYILKKFGVTEYVSNLVSVAIIRELGPLITALVMSGFISGSIAAELGTMQVYEEIMALRTSAIHPNRFLVVPRLLATMIMLPCVTIFADLAGITGGWVIGTRILQLNSDLFISKCFEAVVAKDIYTGLVKSEAFALLLALIGCHQGLSTKGGAEGVGRATTNAVVLSILFVIVADCFFTFLFYFLFEA
ncbi:MAG: ABC transporter permease [Planctomycetes bacterium]|nr:ABC transporter permease [Planctomycetota bacterium]